VLAVGFFPAAVFLMVVLLGMIFSLGDCAWVRRRSVEELTNLYRVNVANESSFLLKRERARLLARIGTAA
jgi:hypothetical protein